MCPRIESSISTLLREQTRSAYRIACMNKIAALPMYNVSPALAADWHALLADVLRNVEPRAAIVEPDDLHAFWRRPDLLLSQTCGYPYVLGLHEHVQLIATP